MKRRTLQSLARALPLLSIFLLAASLTAVFCGCSGGSSDETVPDTLAEDTEPVELTFDFVIDGEPVPIVYPSGCSSDVLNAAREIARSLGRVCGVEFSAVSDAMKNPGADTPEVLVGLTSRAESREAAASMRSRDFFYGIRGKKYLVVATSSSAISSASGGFVELMLQKSRGGESLTLTSAEDRTFNFSNYPFSSFSICGADVSSAELLYIRSAPYSAERYARLFGQWMTEKGGYLMQADVAPYTETHTGIVFGGSAEVADDHGFRIDVSGGVLTVSASCMHGYEAAYSYLTGTLLKGDVVLEEGFSYSSSAADVPDYYDGRDGEYRIIFNNILGNCDTSVYPVPTRNRMIAELHAECLPDVIGLQECSANSRGASSYISAMSKSGYVEVSVEVTNKNKVNYTPLIYRKDRLTVVDSGYYLYNDGGGDQSKSVTWAVFRANNGDLFAVMSTHFFHKSDEAGARARLADAEQIRDLAAAVTKKHVCPVIIGGDLNCNISSEPFGVLTAGGFADVYGLAAKAENLKTYHSYPEFNTALGLYDKKTMPSGSYSAGIDHALVMGGGTLDFRRFEVITDDYALLSTDHCPLLVDFGFKSVG